MTAQGDMIFWREGNHLVAAMLPELTEHIKLNGRALKMTGSLGDYDLLRSEKNDLVGIAFSMTEHDLKCLGTLSEIDAVVVDFPSVRFFLSSCVEPKIQPVQGSSWIYCERGEPVAIGIHKWIEWGSIAFPLNN
jgi:hypothetical protein